MSSVDEDTEPGESRFVIQYIYLFLFESNRSLKCTESRKLVIPTEKKQTKKISAFVNKLIKC